MEIIRARHALNMGNVNEMRARPAGAHRAGGGGRGISLEERFGSQSQLSCYAVVRPACGRSRNAADTALTEIWGCTKARVRIS